MTWTIENQPDARKGIRWLMTPSELFDHCYDQYKVESVEADYLYRRAAVWLSGDVLLATVITALATGKPIDGFRVAISDPTTTIVVGLTCLSLAIAVILLGVSLFPRTYGRFSRPDEILAFRDLYRKDLAQANYPEAFRAGAESEVLLSELTKVLASKTASNFQINETRARLLGSSSLATLACVGGVIILLLSATWSATTRQPEQSMDTENKAVGGAAQGTTASSPAGGSERPPPPQPSSPPPSGTMTKGG